MKLLPVCPAAFSSCRAPGWRGRLPRLAGSALASVGLAAFGLLATATSSAAGVPQAGYLVLELPFDAASQDFQPFGQADDLKSDLLSAPGGGVSRKPSGRALDNSASVGMGGTTQAPGKGGGALVPGGAARLDGALSFTVQGWYRSDAGQIPASYARLIHSHRMSVLFDSAEGQGLVLSTDKGSVLCQDAALRKAGRWVFFAVAHDGSRAADNVFFYAGSESEPVRLVGTGSLKPGALRAALVNSPLVVGNVVEGNRPFDGFIDNVRIWAAPNGTDALLDQAQLETLRKVDAP